MSEHLFTPEALQQIIQKLPPEPNDGKTHSLIGSVDSQGVQVAVVMKFADTWQVQGVVKHDWNGDNTVGAKLIGRW